MTMEFKPSNTRYFSDVDPFNKVYVLTGRICQTGGILGDSYGALNIESIAHKSGNDKLEYENGLIIKTVPKLKYPFTKNMSYTFPSADRIEVFRKYDGTNIYMYRYPNILGGLNTTFKTRALPFLRPEFEEMWRMMLQKYPNIYNLFEMNPNIDGFSFELYGKINHHMIEYDESLDTRLLFARQGDQIISCADLESDNVLTAEKIEDVDGDYVWNYQEHQKKLESALIETEVGFKGDEGYIWYLTQKDNGITRMYKCKPSTIEKIHWSNTSIPRSIIRTTAQNALENVDVITVDFVNELLLEDFTETQVEMSLRRTRQIVIEVNVQHQTHLKIRVLIADIDYLNMELGDVMRKIYMNFEKSEMRHVGSYVKSLREANIKFGKIEQDSV